MLLLTTLVGASVVSAQQAPALQPDATTPAHYDKNYRGVLDPDELAVKAADEKKAAAVVTRTETASAFGDKAVTFFLFEVVADSIGSTPRCQSLLATTPCI